MHCYSACLKCPFFKDESRLFDALFGAGRCWMQSGSWRLTCRLLLKRAGMAMTHARRR